jgi:hypothetical protein
MILRNKINRFFAKGIFCATVITAVGVAGVATLIGAKNKNDLKKAKDKADGRKLYLIAGGTKVNPVKARISNETKDGKIFNNVLHEFDRNDKDREIGLLVETIKDSNYRKWHKFIPTEPYIRLKIPYFVAYIEAKKTILK